MEEVAPSPHLLWEEVVDPLDENLLDSPHDIPLALEEVVDHHVMDVAAQLVVEAWQSMKVHVVLDGVSFELFQDQQSS